MLSPTEKGIYIDLLSFYYSVERPITKEECKRIARAYADEDSQAMQYVLQTHFVDDGDAYRHEKCERVIADARALIAKKRKASQARWNKEKNENPSKSEEKNVCNIDQHAHSHEDAGAYAGGCANDDSNGMLTINHKPNISTDVDLKEKIEKEKPKSKRTKLAEQPPTVTDQTWNDFQEVRKAKHAPLTVTALNGIVKQANEAGITLEEALKVCCERGWQSFKAEWYFNIRQSNNRPMPRSKSSELFDEEWNQPDYYGEGGKIL